ncbi:unnamed protein product, partial [Amoebophrya sp. A120]
VHYKQFPPTTTTTPAGYVAPPPPRFCPAEFVCPGGMTVKDGDVKLYQCRSPYGCVALDCCKVSEKSVFQDVAFSGKMAEFLDANHVLGFKYKTGFDKEQIFSTGRGSSSSSAAEFLSSTTAFLEFDAKKVLDAYFTAHQFTSSNSPVTLSTTDAGKIEYESIKHFSTIENDFYLNHGGLAVQNQLRMKSQTDIDAIFADSALEIQFTPIRAILNSAFGEALMDLTGVENLTPFHVNSRLRKITGTGADLKVELAVSIPYATPESGFLKLIFKKLDSTSTAGGTTSADNSVFGSRMNKALAKTFGMSDPNSADFGIKITEDAKETQFVTAKIRLSPEVKESQELTSTIPSTGANLKQSAFSDDSMLSVAQAAGRSAVLDILGQAGSKVSTPWSLLAIPEAVQNEAGSSS